MYKHRLEPRIAFLETACWSKGRIRGHPIDSPVPRCVITHPILCLRLQRLAIRHLGATPIPSSLTPPASDSLPPTWPDLTMQFLYSGVINSSRDAEGRSWGLQGYLLCWPHPGYWKGSWPVIRPSIVFQSASLGVTSVFTIVCFAALLASLVFSWNVWRSASSS